MAVISVDLAYKRWRDLGIAILTQRADVIEISFVRPPDGDLAVEPLADFLESLCRSHGVRLLLLDGPQAWKDADNGFAHARVCERSLNTPAKTGLPGAVKPKNYTAFVSFSIAVYDALVDRGWTRLERCDAPLDGAGKTLVESFPLSAWRSLRIKALGSKRKTKAADITARLEDLRTVFPLLVTEEPSHDELQALVSGLAGIAMERGASEACVTSGVAPFRHEGIVREGFIVNPVRL